MARLSRAFCSASKIDSPCSRRRAIQPKINRKSVFIFLTARAALRHKLVPLAEEVNAVAVRAAKAEDVATTRRTLLAIIENLARGEMKTQKKRRRIPSTRELGRLVASGKTRRSSAR